MKDLSWAWPEAQRAYRDMQREVNKQRFLESPQGQMLLIDEHFTKVEEDFIAERLKEHETDLFAETTYNNVFLNTLRQYEIGLLLLKTDNENVRAYIKERAKAPLELPALPPRDLTPLEELVEKYFEANYVRKVAS